MKCCCPVVIECIGAFRRRFSSQQILELEAGPQREYEPERKPEREYFDYIAAGKGWRWKGEYGGKGEKGGKGGKS